MAGVQEYKCPACGGGIQFDSATQKMKCPYCDAEFELEALKQFDEVLKEAPAEDMKWETKAGTQWQEGETGNMAVYSCQSCGGEIVADATTGATNCPYCDNPVVMMGQFSGDLRPNYVIPFKLDKNAAKEGMKKHFMGKRLLPKVFKDENHIDEVKGVYVPFWLFDADSNANIRYKATKVRHWSDSNYDYTETKYYSVVRAGSLGFNRVPVDGSSQMPDDLMESVEPFDESGMVDFQTAYLSGYLADKYDVTAEQSEARANQRIKDSTVSTFASTVQGYSSVIPESTSISLINPKTSYALYPVWILNTTWRDKKYLFAMNGQTGKFVGNLPCDMGAFWRWLLGLGAGFGVIIYIFMLIFH